MPGEPKTVIRVYVENGGFVPEVQILAGGVNYGEILLLQAACLNAFNMLSQMIPTRPVSKDDQDEARRLLDDGPG